MKSVENLLLGIIILILALVTGGIIYLRFIFPSEIPRSSRPIIAPEITPLETTPMETIPNGETSYIYY